MHIVVEADGGSRGNPGPAGYGAVLFDGQTGEVLDQRQAGLGSTTNNVAEYTGLIEGLRAARQLNATTVEARMDSKLVVEQMSGRWQVKNDTLRVLAAEAAGLAAAFESVSYLWIPRASNTRADALANEAMDEQARAETGSPDEQREHVPSHAAASAQPTAPAAWTGAQGAPTRLFLLRHGQTAMSIDRRYSGRGDVALTEHGVWQAGAAAKRLADLSSVHRSGQEHSHPRGELRVLASPLSRAVATAGAVTDLLGGDVGVHEGLIETDFGSWEGLTFGEAAQRDPQLHRAWLGDGSVAAPHGESFEQVHRRVSTVLDEVLEAHNGQNIVLVTHVTPIKTVLRIALEAGPALLFRLHLDLASISVVEFYPDGNASVRLVNDTSHLG